jgi:hypothetical protein
LAWRAMGLSNAERQARWRERREALLRGHPDVIERALLQAAERCSQLSEQERRALADKIADAALGHLHRAQALAGLARLLCLGER